MFSNLKVSVNGEEFDSRFSQIEKNTVDSKNQLKENEYVFLKIHTARD